ncbi:MAG: TIM barrel protein [Acidobacteriota bacterium]|nr:TIM barrel protein [Acidobacteriota bacterium]
MTRQRHTFDRRQMLAGATLGLAAAAHPVWSQSPRKVVRNARVNQSVCKWCFRDFTVDELCEAGAAMGLRSVELLGPEDFATVKKHGLVCALTNAHGITKGLNDPANHGECLDAIRKAIDATADAGFPNVITFSGNRNGVPDDVGLEHCVTAVRQVIGQAEKRGVTIVMELLNSKVNHADYMCDKTPWGVELVDRVASERFKLLYDIYHMQIMEGDVIRTIQDHHDKIGHYHTAGNPGRHELDHTQELQYAPIMRAIVETGYQGYVAQEFIPTRDPLQSLAEAVELCDV